MEAGRFRINVHSLRAGENTIEFAGKHEDFEFGEDADFELAGVLNVQCRIYKLEGQLTLDAVLSGKVKLRCDRCLDNYEHDLKSSFRIVYKMRREEGEGESEDENLRYISPNAAFIDLKNDIRDYVMLAIPMRRVPDEAGGKCSVCGRSAEQIMNRETKNEINPVWEKLIRIKSK